VRKVWWHARRGPNEGTGARDAVVSRRPSSLRRPSRTVRKTDETPYRPDGVRSNRRREGRRESRGRDSHAGRWPACPPPVRALPSAGPCGWRLPCRSAGRAWRPTWSRSTRPSRASRNAASAPSPTPFPVSWGVTPNYKELRPTPLSRGEFFGPEEQSSAARVAILGPNTAAALFGDAGPLDETIRLDTAPFTVIGILKQQGASPGGAAILLPGQHRLTKSLMRL